MDFFYLKIQIATSLATNECHPQHKWSMYLRLTYLIITDKELNTHKKENKRINKLRRRF